MRISAMVLKGATLKLSISNQMFNLWALIRILRNHTQIHQWCVILPPLPNQVFFSQRWAINLEKKTVLVDLLKLVLFSPLKYLERRVLFRWSPMLPSFMRNPDKPDKPNSSLQPSFFSYLLRSQVLIVKALMLPLNQLLCSLLRNKI